MNLKFKLGWKSTTFTGRPHDKASIAVSAKLGSKTFDCLKTVNNICVLCETVFNFLLGERANTETDGRLTFDKRNFQVRETEKIDYP